MTDSYNNPEGVMVNPNVTHGKPAHRIVKLRPLEMTPGVSAPRSSRRVPRLNVRLVPKSAGSAIQGGIFKTGSSHPPLAKAKNHPCGRPFASNRYQIIKVIHEGGFGTVFKVMDKMLKMEVAIKVLKPDVSRDVEAITQLKAEAAVAMRLSHENIVRLHNIESDGGCIFLVMEYIDGQTLREIIDQMGALSLPAVLDIAHSCSEAMTYAHSQGVLHRDIKPENIMITSKMSLKLLDFGLAMRMSHGRDKNDYIEGSPGYLSPEQLHGLPLDARTDVFSFAAVVCELLTGQRAFPHASGMKHMYDHDPVGIDTLPPTIAKIIQWGLSRDVTSRYNSPAEFYTALEQVIRPLLT